MSKRFLTIILFLSLSLFLVMPVHAADAPPFEKTTDVYPGDLDYRNSLVDWNGYNIDLVMYWNKAGGLPPDSVAFYTYINNQISIATDNWVNIGDSIFQLNLSNSQKTEIKNILFSRTYNPNNYIRIRFTQKDFNLSGFLFEFRVTFSSLLNINLGSVFIMDMIRQESAGMISYFNKSVDIVGIENTIGGGQATFIQAQVQIDNETTQAISTSVYPTPGTDTQRQFANYNFISKYTNVHQLNYNFVISLNNYDPRPRGNYYIFQLGFFADTQVILPDLDVDTDFQIYAPTTCGAFDLGCVSRNLIGEFSNNIYNRLGAENIASGIMNIYDTIFYPVYIIDAAAWQNGIISIYAIIGIGVLYLIVKRVLG